jgi:hypothetical protein
VTMKLSEAIRLGAMMRPQSFSGLYEEHSRGILGLTTQRETSCAIGAAYEAAGVTPVTETAKKGDVLGGFRGQISIAQGGETLIVYPDPWYAFTQTVRACPVCSKEDALTISRMIPHLNDHHRWTRERIADWVETIERERQQADEAATPTNAVASPVEVA